MDDLATCSKYWKNRFPKMNRRSDMSGWNLYRKLVVGALVWSLGGLAFGPVKAHAGVDAKELIENNCSSCHRFSGEPLSRLKLKAPDLKWGGNKYQHEWLVSFLQGKEEMLYPNGYRWDIQRKQTDHVKLNSEQAEAVAQYFEKNFLDSRVEKDAFSIDKLTQREVELGAGIFKEYSCLGCHQVKEDGKKIGGPISANLYNAGQRYNFDWLFRFALNPQDFTPHSGEYLADISPLKLRHLLGYLMAQGVENYPIHVPWETQAFKKGDSKHGKKLYKEYCVQCHGPEGKGDGVGALGLTNPPPANHFQMALSELPMDYLYNVVYYGGKSVGKSPNMPDWGITIHGQDFADLIAFLRTNFKGVEEVKTAASTAGAASGDCTQPRTTKKAPSSFLSKKNPVSATAANIAAGEKLFLKDAKPVACLQCHGKKGDGKGPLGGGLKPKPRDFTCAPMMKDISDGQMFWIIKNGSQGTGMMPFKTLKDKQAWQVIRYLRTLAK